MKKILFTLPILFIAGCAYADVSASGAISFGGALTVGTPNQTVSASGGNISVVQSSCVQLSGSLSNISSTFTAPTGANSMIWCWFVNGGNTPTSVQDDKSNLYSLWSQRGNGGTFLWTYVSTHPASGVNWVQVNFGANSNHTIGITEVSGLSNSSGTTVLSGTGTSTTVVSATTGSVSGVQSLYLCAGTDDSGISDTFTAGSGFTRDIHKPHTQSGIIQLYTEWQISTSDLSCSGTLGSSANWTITGEAWH